MFWGKEEKETTYDYVTHPITGARVYFDKPVDKSELRIWSKEDIKDYIEKGEVFLHLCIFRQDINFFRAVKKLPLLGSDDYNYQPLVGFMWVNRQIEQMHKELDND